MWLHLQKYLQENDWKPEVQSYTHFNSNKTINQDLWPPCETGDEEVFFFRKKYPILSWNNRKTLLNIQNEGKGISPPVQDTVK